jgi:phosphotriesterase-related protein
VSDLAGKVQTVLGPIDPEDLGRTLMHEHILTDLTPLDQRRDLEEAVITFENLYDAAYNWMDTPGIRRFTEPEIAVREMELMLEDGGRSIVDASTPGMEIFPDGLRRVAERSGAQIIMGCGRYLASFMNPADIERGVDDLAAEFVGCIRDGFNGTGVKAGLIGEIGCSWPWTEAEKRSVEAAVLAQRETGAAVSIHPGLSEDSPFLIVDMLRKGGADLSRSIICHVERRLFDTDGILRLADTGVVLEFDLFGVESSRFPMGRDVSPSSDGVRLDRIRSLIEHGHGDRIVISQDIIYRTRRRSLGGHGYGHIFRNIVPMMRRRDFTEAEIDALLVENPKRLLTFA